jgi:predicted CopG family antitoxin
MGETEYRNVRLTEDAYQRLKMRKREGESFSDTVARIAGERSLLDLVGVLSDEEADAMRDVIREREEDSRARLDRLVDEMDL